MIPFIEDCYFYKRIDNTLIAVKTTGEEVPVVQFHHHFIDLLVVDKQPLEYMKRFMEMFPHLWEYVRVEPKPITEQLKLF